MQAKEYLFDVTYEVRIIGSKDEYRNVTFRVRAVDKMSARDKAHEQANKEGMETRFPREILLINE